MASELKPRTTPQARPGRTAAQFGCISVLACVFGERRVVRPPFGQPRPTQTALTLSCCQRTQPSSAATSYLPKYVMADLKTTPHEPRMRSTVWGATQRNALGLQTLASDVQHVRPCLRSGRPGRVGHRRARHPRGSPRRCKAARSQRRCASGTARLLSLPVAGVLGVLPEVHLRRPVVVCACTSQPRPVARGLRSTHPPRSPWCAAQARRAREALDAAQAACREERPPWQQEGRGWCSSVPAAVRVTRVRHVVSARGDVSSVVQRARAASDKCTRLLAVCRASTWWQR